MSSILKIVITRISPISVKRSNKQTVLYNSIISNSLSRIVLLFLCDILYIYILIIVVQRTASEAKSSDLMKELAQAVASNGPMEMGRQLYDARLIKRKNYFVLASKLSDTALNQGHLVAQYIKEDILDDDDTYKKFLLFLKKDRTMSKVYIIVLQMRKYYQNYYFIKLVYCTILAYSLGENTGLTVLRDHFKVKYRFSEGLITLTL